MLTILLVEQDGAERDRFVRAIAADHRVIAVAALDDAWASLVDADLLIVDLVQSGDANLTVLDRVRALRPELPVVITATATLQGWRLLRTGMQLGAREFLTKPFDDAEVRQTVRTATQSERFEASSLSA